jgi:hypothetical protein
MAFRNRSRAAEKSGADLHLRRTVAVQSGRSTSSADAATRWMLSSSSRTANEERDPRHDHHGYTACKVRCTAIADSC